MDRSIDYMLEVMQAAKDGKQIQYRTTESNSLGWLNISKPVWEWATVDYRVKPEVKKTRTGYRRFIFKQLTGEYDVGVTFDSALSALYAVDKQPDFVDWLDKEWQYHAVIDAEQQG